MTQLENCVAAFCQARLKEYNELKIKLWDTAAGRAEALSGDLDNDASQRQGDKWLEIVKKVAGRNAMEFYSNSARDEAKSWVKEVSEKAVSAYFESARLKEKLGAESLKKSVDGANKWEAGRGSEQLLESINKANSAVNEFAICITDRIRELADTQVDGESITDTAWDALLPKACGIKSSTSDVPPAIVESARTLANVTTMRHGQMPAPNAKQKAFKFYTRIAANVARSYKALI